MKKQKGFGDVVLLGILVVMFTYFRADIYNKTTQEIEPTESEHYTTEDK